MGGVEVSLFETFQRRRESAGMAPLFTLVDEAGRHNRQLTVAETADRIEAIAGFLRHECRLRSGDRVVLAFTPSIEFVAAFLGCLRASLVPVPVPAPEPTGPRSVESARRFSAMCAAVEARVILTNRAYLLRRFAGDVLRVFRGDRSSPPRIPWHATDGVAAGSYDAPVLPTPKAYDLAFIQYTAGATGEPKGVRVTHGNVRHQLAALATALDLDAETRAVFWAPHFHPLCLIGGILSAFSGNGRLYLMPPRAVLRRPDVWFDVLSRVRATHTAAPNLALALAVRKTTTMQRLGWDLRPLRRLVTAAEPARYATVRAFFETFAPTGLNAQAFCPAYGLAEHGLAVATGGREVLRVDRRGLERDGVARLAHSLEDNRSDTSVLVGSGHPFAGADVRIVDPETRLPLPDGRVGEIWIHSASVADGYVERAANEPDAFDARLAAPDGGIPHLRTGDFGFLYRGELFVTGRRTDVIRLGERMLHPEDVEETVREAHPLLRPGGVVACSVHGGGADGLAVLAELQAMWVTGPLGMSIVETIRRRVQEDHGAACTLVWLGRPGSIPRTMGGTPMRTRCRNLLARGTEIPGTLYATAVGGRRRPSRLPKWATSHVIAWPR